MQVLLVIHQQSAMRMQSAMDAGARFLYIRILMTMFNKTKI